MPKENCLPLRESKIEIKIEFYRGQFHHILTLSGNESLCQVERFVSFLNAFIPRQRVSLGAAKEIRKWLSL